VQDANAHGNTGTTLLGAADAAVHASEWSRYGQALNGASSSPWWQMPAAVGDDVAGMSSGVPGSSALGHAGGAFAALGLANDVHDMTQNGVNVDNGMSATGNALGVGSYAAGTFGAAGGTAATVAAPLMAAAAGGLAVGGVMNSIADSEYALDENGMGTDDHWQDSIIEDAIANGEDPTSVWNIAKGTAAGTVGQIADVGRGIGNWLFD
jgi:hypothetical protein